MIGFIKKIKKKIDDGMLSEMYMEAKWIYSYVKSYKLAIIFYVFLGILGVVKFDRTVALGNAHTHTSTFLHGVSF